MPTIRIEAKETVTHSCDINVTEDEYEALLTHEAHEDVEMDNPLHAILIRYLSLSEAEDGDKFQHVVITDPE